jgi:hypothetical protein
MIVYISVLKGVLDRMYKATFPNQFSSLTNLMLVVSYLAKFLVQQEATLGHLLAC